MQKTIIGIFLVLVLSLVITGCSEKRIEIGKIETRAQLDSIISLMSSDSVRIDSFPDRTLRMRLKGKFSLYGVPVDEEVNFRLIKEELSEMSVWSVPSGGLSALNSIEREHGLGAYKSQSYKWAAGIRNMELKINPEEGSLFDFLLPKQNKQNTSETLGFTYRVDYAPNVQNKITDIHKELETERFVGYNIMTFFSYRLNARLYVNDILIADAGEAINTSLNPFLFQRGRQTLIAELVPPYDKLKELDSYVKGLTGGGEQIVKITQENVYNGKKSEDITFYIETDINRYGKVQAFEFDIPDLSYEQLFANAVDLRSAEGLKPAIYEKYEKLKEAFETRNTDKIIDLLYSPFKNEAMSHNWDFAGMQEEWALIERMIDDNEGADLLPIDDVDIKFVANGRLAKLVPKQGKGIEWESEKGNSLSAFLLYVTYLYPKDLALYVYMDHTENINFALKW